MLTTRKQSVFNGQKLQRFILSFLFLISFEGCFFGDSSNDKCKDTEANEFELRITPNIQIVHENGEPCDDYAVKFEIYKTYCSGEISGEFSTETKTNAEGYAYFNTQYFYTFANTEDRVIFAYTITYGAQHVVTKVISYDIANKAPSLSSEQKLLELDIDYFDRAPIVVPWNP